MRYGSQFRSTVPLVCKVFLASGRISTATYIKPNFKPFFISISKASCDPQACTHVSLPSKLPWKRGECWASGLLFFHFVIGEVGAVAAARRYFSDSAGIGTVDSTHARSPANPRAASDFDYLCFPAKILSSIIPTANQQLAHGRFGAIEQIQRHKAWHKGRLRPRSLAHQPASCQGAGMGF